MCGECLSFPCFGLRRRAGQLGPRAGNCEWGNSRIHGELVSAWHPFAPWAKNLVSSTLQQAFEGRRSAGRRGRATATRCETPFYLPFPSAEFAKTERAR